MKCDQCDNEATVHEVTVRNGVKIEKHLCEVCAAQQGISVQGGIPLSEMMSKFMVASGAASPAGATQAKAGACPTCRLSFAEFRQAGLLGCPDCYRTFEAQLAPLIERAHEGGAGHEGKFPKRASGKGEQLAALAERAERLRLLQDELKQAVTREEYERAARLRDELRRVVDESKGQ